MVKRQRRMTKKNSSKKAAPKVKPKQHKGRSSSKKPSKGTAPARANQAMKVLTKALKNQEDSE